MKAHSFIHEMTANSGIFGREKGIRVVFEGDRAYTDGSTINLPAIPRDVELTQEQIMMMRGYVDHEAGHLRHSDMPLLMDKYQRWCHNGKQDLKDLHNQIEDIWMEAKVMAEYPGSTKNLKQTNKSVGEQGLQQLKDNPELKENLKGIDIKNARAAISVQGRKTFNSEPDNVIRDLLDPKLIAHADEWVRQIHECKNSTDTINLAKSIYKLIKQDDPNLESNPEDLDPNSGEGIEDGDSPSDSRGGKGKPKPGESDAEMQALADKLKEALEKLIEGEIPGGIGNPQGDYVGSYKVYSTADDVVLSAKNPGKAKQFTSPTHGEYDKTRESIREVVMVIKGQLRRVLQARDQRDWDGGREIGRLDTKRLVSASQGNKLVFKKRIDREEMNTAVLILVDLSGSMSSSGKSQVAQQTAIALSECFEGTSIKYSVAGFKAMYREDTPNSGNWHRVDANVIYNFKPFETGLRQSREHIAGIVSSIHDHTYGGNNADNDAIQWAIDTLSKRDERRKVLLVLSDGQPENDTRNVSSTELTRHAALSVKYAEKKGIECIGIGICSDAVKNIYGDHVVVHKVQELSEKVFKKFAKILLNNKGK